MLLNGVLFNSESWHGVTDNDMKTPESIDEQLLRSLVSAQAKTALEFLYLETGTVPIRFLVSSRRMIYLQNILKREEGELIKKIYKAQAENPSPGDFSELLKDDFNMIEENLEENAIMKTSVESTRNSSRRK